MAGRGGARGSGLWWFLLPITIPALLLIAVLLAPKLQPGAFSAADIFGSLDGGSVDSITVVQGAGSVTPAAAHSVAAPAGPLRIENKSQEEWLDEQVKSLVAKLESDIDDRIAKKIKEFTKELAKEAKRSGTNDAAQVETAGGTEDLEKLAASKVEKVLGSMQEKINLNLDIEKRVAARFDKKLNADFDKDLDNKFATTAESLGLLVVTPGMKLPATKSEKAYEPAKLSEPAPAPAPAPPPPPALEPPELAKKSTGPAGADAFTTDQIVNQPTTACKSWDVHLTPKDYCGSRAHPTGRGSNCFTVFEEDYLEKHHAELVNGLAALRSPGCFPAGLSVATMGYYRTGSTLLYNVARLWASLGAGKSLVSGFGCKSPEVMGIGVKDAKQELCSMVCKDHEWKHGVAEEATVVLMSRRDPWESVCSRRLMDLWCRLRQDGAKKQASAKVKEAYQKECLRNHTIEALESQMQCKDLMAMQARIYLERRQKGKDIAYDMLLSDYQSSSAGTATQVKNIAKAMGICEAAYEDAGLVEFVVATGTRLHDKPDQDMGITQMHDVHTDAQREAKCSQLREWMREDEECAKWMDNDASAEHNAVLKRMEKEGKKKKGKKKEKEKEEE